MDLTSYDNFVINWTNIDDVLTLEFKDATETVTIGTISVQGTRIISLLSALQEASRVYEPVENDATTREYSKTSHVEDKTIIEF